MEHVEQLHAIILMYDITNKKSFLEIQVSRLCKNWTGSGNETQDRSSERQQDSCFSMWNKKRQRTPKVIGGLFQNDMRILVRNIPQLNSILPWIVCWSWIIFISWDFIKYLFSGKIIEYSPIVRVVSQKKASALANTWHSEYTEINCKEHDDVSSLVREVIKVYSSRKVPPMRFGPRKETFCHKVGRKKWVCVSCCLYTVVTIGLAIMLTFGVGKNNRIAANWAQ